MADTEIVESIAADTRDVYTHVSVKMVQATALVAPPVFLAKQLYQKNFTVNRWLRKSAAWTFVFGSTSGLAMAWLRLRNEPDIAIYDRAYRLKHSASQVRVDDYTKVGGLLGALLTTTVFLKRAPIVTNLAGGAVLGIAGGVITHTVKMMQEEGAEKAAVKTKEALPDPVELGKGIAKGT